MTTMNVRKYNATPARIRSSPKEVALVLACIRLNDSPNLSNPMDAIRMKTEPRNNNMEVSAVIKQLFFYQVIFAPAGHQ